MAWKPYLPQRGEILEPLADAEVPRIVDRGLGAQRTALFVVLLDARSFVVDVQRGGDALGEDAGTEAARGAAGDAPVEDELDLVGAPDVEILADDFLEDDAAGDRLVEDLREGELRLQDRDVVAIARFAVGRRVRVGEPGEPLAGEGVDPRGREAIARGLGPARGGATEQPVVEGLEGYAGPGELLLHVLMPVQTELARVGEVGAELHEERAEVAIDAVEVEVRDHGRGPHEPRVGLPGLRVPALLRAQDRRLLLRPADEDDPLVTGKARAVRRRDGLLALARMEGDQRNALGLDERGDGRAKPLADGLHRRRRREGLAAVFAKEVDYPTPDCRPGT